MSKIKQQEMTIAEYNEMLMDEAFAMLMDAKESLKKAKVHIKMADRAIDLAQSTLGEGKKE